MLENKTLEYSFDVLSEELIKRFELENVTVVEESFNNQTVYKIYSETNIDEYFTNNGIAFKKRDINEINWLEEWKNFLKPGLLCEKMAFKNDINIIFEGLDAIYINPSLAFGTGSHPTTHIAASLLEEVCENAIVFDVGTGSGILSILSEKLGAKKIYACEIDKNCINNIRENIKGNNCKNIDVYIGSIDYNYMKIKCDIIVANIMCDTLIYLWQYMASISPDYIILSGFYKQDLVNFLATIQIEDYKIEKLACIDNWWGIRFCKLL